MKKILIFSMVYYPEWGGGSDVAIQEITDRIDTKDYEFHMVCLRFDSTLPKVEKVGNILVHRIGFSVKNPTEADFKKWPVHLNKYLYQITAAFKGLALQRKHTYDAVWAMMPHTTGVPAGMFSLFQPRIPLILTLQEGDPPEYIERKVKPLWTFFKRAFTHAKTIQIISNFLGDWAHKLGATGTIELIPNGFNPSYFSIVQKKDELEVLKEKLGKKPDDIYLVTVSRLVHKNAVDDVIRSLQYLSDDIKFVIVGGGPDEEMLRDLAKELKVDDRVIFIGQVNRTETTKYRLISDIFVRPSRSEGMGNSFVSTMIAGLPIITTQEGGIADFLFDAKRNPDKETTGWAVDKDSPQQIADAVNDILANPEQVKKVVETAKNLAEKNYNWDNIAVDMQTKIFDSSVQGND